MATNCIVLGSRLQRRFQSVDNSLGSHPQRTACMAVLSADSTTCLTCSSQSLLALSAGDGSTHLES